MFDPPEWDRAAGDQELDRADTERDSGCPGPGRCQPVNCPSPPPRLTRTQQNAPQARSGFFAVLAIEGGRAEPLKLVRSRKKPWKCVVHHCNLTLCKGLSATPQTGAQVLCAIGRRPGPMCYLNAMVWDSGADRQVRSDYVLTWGLCC